MKNKQTLFKVSTDIADIGDLDSESILDDNNLDIISSYRKTLLGRYNIKESTLLSKSFRKISNNELSNSVFFNPNWSNRALLSEENFHPAESRL